MPHRIGSNHRTNLSMDLNHDNQMGARADHIGDQAFPAMCWVGIAFTLLDS